MCLWKKINKCLCAWKVGTKHHGSTFRSKTWESTNPLATGWLSSKESLMTMHYMDMSDRRESRLAPDWIVFTRSYQPIRKMTRIVICQIKVPAARNPRCVSLVLSDHHNSCCSNTVLFTLILQAHLNNDNNGILLQFTCRTLYHIELEESVWSTKSLSQLVWELRNRFMLQGESSSVSRRTGRFLFLSHIICNVTH